MKVGIAKVDITPDINGLKVCLNGYTDRKKALATGVRDRLYARAIVMSDQDGKLFGLVGTDLCYIATDLRDDVLKRLSPQGFNDDNLTIAATHTHSSFGGYDRTFIAKILFAPFDQRVFDHTAERIARAVSEAKKDMREAKIEIGSVDMEGMNRSRLDPAFVFGDGKAGQAIQPNPEKYPVDERMTVLKITQADSDRVCVVIHYAAHPTILSPKNMQISADFCGVLCKKVEDTFGDDAVALFLNGTLGDTAPLPDWTDDLATEIAQMADYGDKLADAVGRALEGVHPFEGERIFCKTVRVKAPKVVIRQLKKLTVPSFLSKLFYPKREIPYQVIRMGNLILLAVCGELTTEVGNELNKMCPADAKCLVIAPANSYVGYIVTPKQYEDGGYASDTCFFGPNAITYVKDAFQKALAGI